MNQLDTSLLAIGPAKSKQLSDKYGLTISNSNGAVSLVNKSDLRLETVFETEYGKMTLEVFKNSSHQKVRCQAVFRPDSSSWNGYLSKHKDGSPFHYDNGTHIKYTLPQQLIAKGLWSQNDWPLTDTGNAERFVDLAGGNCQYITELNRFIIYEDDMWDYASKEVIMRATKTVARSILNEAAACTIEEKEKDLLSWQHYSESKSARNSMLDLVKHEIPLPFTELDKDKSLIGCQNGIVDLPTQALLPSNRDHFVVSKMNASFVPSARAPRFERFVDEITDGDPLIAEYLQVFFGMTLLGINPKQIMLMMVGHGANGKSVLLETIQDIFGDYGATVEPEVFMDSKYADSSKPRPEIVRLAGKRLCVTTEPPKGARLNENLIKRFTGGDKISARVPYAKEEVVFKPNLVPVMSSNHDVRIDGTDHGIWRRIKQIHFRRQFEPDKEKGLEQQLLSERDGIFNWLLKGVKMYLEDGLNDPPAVVDNTKRYRNSQDIVAEWLDDCCLLNQGDTKQKVLYDSYANWCKGNGYRPLQSRGFYDELRGRGYPIDRGRNGKPVIGVKLI